jgi:hypothetical protein
VELSANPDFWYHPRFSVPIVPNNKFTIPIEIIAIGGIGIAAYVIVKLLRRR